MEVEQLSHDGGGQMHDLVDVLMLALETCPDLSTPQTLCSLLCVSSGCRVAVQRVAGHCSVSIQQHARLASLAAWLPAHHGLVTRLDFVTTEWDSDDRSGHDAITAALQQCAAAPGEQRRRLCSLDVTHHVGAPQILQVLVPARLQDLTMYAVGPVVCTPHLAVVLGQLSSLTALSLSTRAGVPGRALADAVGDAVGRLQRLAKLELDTVRRCYSRQLCERFPPSLVTLYLGLGGGSHDLQLGHLTSLRQLHMSESDEWPTTVSPHSVLPPHMTSLHCQVNIAEAVAVFSSLLCLKLDRSIAVRTVVSVLPNLTQFDFDWPMFSLSELHKLVAAVGVHGTCLTALSCSGYPAKDDDPQYEGIKVGSAVAQLKHLRQLTLGGLGCGQAELLKLACLTGLTSLHLWSCAGACTDVAAAVARGFAGLHELCIDGCGCWAVVLPALANLGLDSRGLLLPQH